MNVQQPEVFRNKRLRYLPSGALDGGVLNDLDHEFQAVDVQKAVVGGVISIVFMFLEPVDQSDNIFLLVHAVNVSLRSDHEQRDT